ncbi:MIP/aquaporin family protein [Gardnerella swidsinskii]|uniref:MIP/aquaporin family protein n=1 Tax=Gardnerella swidsinskii TaxID=2792979 RepID=UPI0036F467D8
MIKTTDTTCDTTKTAAPLIVRIGTEFIATALAMFVVYTFYSLTTVIWGFNVLTIAVGTGLAYAAATHIASKVSGGHLNPAITVASMLTGRTSYVSGLCYILAQVFGAVAAARLFLLTIPQKNSNFDPSQFDQISDSDKKYLFMPLVNGFGKGSISAYTKMNLSFGIVSALLVEVIAVILIVAAALRSTDNKGNTKCGYATHIGIAYAVGTLITYTITGAGLNPARSTGIAIFANSYDLDVKPLSQLWVFWVAPIFAAAIVSLVSLLTKFLSNSAQKLAVSNETNSEPAQKSADAKEDEKADAPVAPDMSYEYVQNVSDNNVANNL